MNDAVPALDALPHVASSRSHSVPTPSVGRPYVYGPAIDGEDDVEAVMKNFLADLDLTLGLIGYDDVEDVDREAVVRADELQPTVLYGSVRNCTTRFRAILCTITAQ